MVVVITAHCWRPPIQPILQLSMPTRRRAREIVLQLLYENDLNPDQSLPAAKRFLSARMHDNQPLIAFASGLLDGVLKRRKSIDAALSGKATHWSLRRMSAVDRNILRLATYEILHAGTPGPVAINEAIELAKRYGDRQSGQFVNGILDRLLREGESADQPTSPDACRKKTGSVPTELTGQDACTTP